ncbi:hypothetical protein ACFXKD_29365 [Nocardiopsis aegyptia]|uniref:hypothetical protein n=1 Tax=Nocardiopsis aegyptia TaxID=220378 RepID=UPI003672334C
MSVVMLFGAGALIGLVALTLVVIVTLLVEKPPTPPAARETADDEAADRAAVDREDRPVL